MVRLSSYLEGTDLEHWILGGEEAELRVRSPVVPHAIDLGRMRTPVRAGSPCENEERCELRVEFVVPAAVPERVLME